MRENNGLALVRGHKKLIRVPQDGLRIRGARREFLKRSNGRFCRLFCVELAHHAAERAARALGKDSRRMRVPGIGDE